ncbi:MAG: hypothetical protein UR26_C0001G0093 [candidate division TM6 bacterium GW2011_GWF2_32_72]|nr:MAG: hypothetical protein UR26_C0001G0093 [candidate division TM6 bacterium GW2011_GWF2_32_72]
METLKNHSAKSGFMLMEVLFAVVIFGTVFTLLLRNQMNLTINVYRTSAIRSRLFQVKDLLVRASSDVNMYDKKKYTKEVNFPDTVLTYSLDKIQKSSSLKSFKNLFIQKVVGKSSEGSESLVTLFYKMEKKKKEPEKTSLNQSGKKLSERQKPEVAQ